MGINVINESFFPYLGTFIISKVLTVTLYLLSLLSNLPMFSAIHQCVQEYFNFRPNPPEVSGAISTHSTMSGVQKGDVYFLEQN